MQMKSIASLLALKSKSSKRPKVTLFTLNNPYLVKRMIEREEEQLRIEDQQTVGTGRLSS